MDLRKLKKKFDVLRKPPEEEVSSIDLMTTNDTVGGEAKPEHWIQWSWRPFNGFLFGITIVFAYIVLPMMGIPSPDIPTEVWIGWGGILGIASWFRGQVKAK